MLWSFACSIAEPESTSTNINVSGVPASINASTPTTLTGLLIGSSGYVSSVTLPSGAVVGTTASQTLSDKTLTSPIINGIVATSGLTLPALTLSGTVFGDSKAITALSGLSLVGGGQVKSYVSNSYITVGGGSTIGSGNSAFFLLSGKDFSNGYFQLFTSNTEKNADISRLLIPGGANTSIIYWQASTQTWQSYGAGALTTDANGNITAVSDERVKDIKGNFLSGLKHILNIKPILYNYKLNSGYDEVNTYAGFSAQNVMRYIPEAVGQNPDGKYTLIDRAILASLVNSVRELQDEIDVLNAKLGMEKYDRTVLPDLSESKIIKPILSSIKGVNK